FVAVLILAAWWKAAPAARAQAPAVAPKKEGPADPLPVGPNGQPAPYADIAAGLRSPGPQNAAPTDRDAAESLGELHKGQAALREALKSLRVSFELYSERKQELAIETKLAKEGKLVPPNYSFAMTFALKGEKRYQSYREIERPQGATGK